MDDRKSGGKTALHVLAFVGVTVLLLIIALLAALFIATKGPSEAAREAVYDWAAERNMQSVAGIFLSAEEKDALAGRGEEPGPGINDPVTTERPLITLTDEAPVQSSETPEESPEATGEAEPESTENAEEAA